MNCKIIKTVPEEQIFWQQEEKSVQFEGDCMHSVELYPDVTEQTVVGFGGAFTEASAHTFAGLSEEEKKKVIEGYFGEDGLRYNVGRIPMHSCDFGLGNYTYVEEGDETLSSFSVSHDEKEILPMITMAREEALRTGQQMKFLTAPWSPPAFMKTNGEMNHGGRLKKEYYELWAKYFVKFLKAYKEAGVEISYLTVQNEPEAVQTWDSCEYNAVEEVDFIKNYLAKELKDAGLSHIKILVWDHNKEGMYRRTKEAILAAGEQSNLIGGVAVHWYTGDHFDAIRAVRKAFPDKSVFFAEGCVEFSRFSPSDEVLMAEMYAHDMIGNFGAGVEAFFDWNLLLDEKGGPNHVGNFCAAPMMLKKDKATKRLSYYYIGQLSRYVRPGAKMMYTSTYCKDLETVGFVNPDGERVVIILNPTDKTLPAAIRHNEGGQGVYHVFAPHSIATICFT
ncbi:MAG: glucosylceramidase [Lachnospiraceae bacterium]|nr:glucosylceramidase [Lachnospiraceae bacterium]